MNDHTVQALPKSIAWANANICGKRYGKGAHALLYASKAAAMLAKPPNIGNITYARLLGHFRV